MSSKWLAFSRILAFSFCLCQLGNPFFERSVLQTLAILAMLCNHVLLFFHLQSQLLDCSRKSTIYFGPQEACGIPPVHLGPHPNIPKPPVTWVANSCDGLDMIRIPHQSGTLENMMIDVSLNDELSDWGVFNRKAIFWEAAWETEGGQRCLCRTMWVLNWFSFLIS